MEDLFERAEREGLWFYTNYQQMWFSPKELKKYQAEGRFRWGPLNWHLRNPREALDEAARQMAQAQQYYETLKAQIERGG
jgi:hypothetical protein